MSQTANQSLPYSVQVHTVAEGEQIVFTFLPKERPANASTPECIVVAHPATDALNWDRSSVSSEAVRQEIEVAVRERLEIRREWLERIEGLVDEIEAIAMSAGWATRRLTKKIDDQLIGKHTVPGLVMQEDYCRILLEALSRVAPGASGGLADLYLMPAYDDIASIYHYDGAWHLHYKYDGSLSVDNDREAQALPLDEAHVLKVLHEMKQHAEKG